MSLGMMSYLVLSTLALLIGCDGRLAAVSIVIIVIAVPFLRNLSSRWSVFYLPIVLVLSAGLVCGFDLDPANDNFSGRLAGSIGTLSQVGLAGLAGLDAASSDRAADSGIAYFLLTQSAVGVTIIWLAVCLVPGGRIYSMRLYTHGIAIFIPLNLMVSYSFFSIKVASLIWFSYGYYFSKDCASEASPISDEGFPSRKERAVA
jgi:putative polymerase